MAELPAGYMRAASRPVSRMNATTTSPTSAPITRLNAAVTRASRSTPGNDIFVFVC